MKIEWDELTKGKLFITDLGENQRAVVKNEEKIIGRYAVWSPITNSKSHQVIEVNSDLNYLAEKYKIPQERICYIN